MAEYSINKGIGRSAEFKGLKSQYLFIFAGGLLAVFVVFVVMYMAGVGQWICIGFGIVAASVCYIDNTGMDDVLCNIKVYLYSRYCVVNYRHFKPAGAALVKNGFIMCRNQ